MKKPKLPKQPKLKPIKAPPKVKLVKLPKLKPIKTSPKPAKLFPTITPSKLTRQAKSEVKTFRKSIKAAAKILRFFRTPEPRAVQKRGENSKYTPARGVVERARRNARAREKGYTSYAQERLAKGISKGLTPEASRGHLKREQKRVLSDYAAKQMKRAAASLRKRDDPRLRAIFDFILERQGRIGEGVRRRISEQDDETIKRMSSSLSVKKWKAGWMGWQGREDDNPWSYHGD